MKQEDFFSLAEGLLASQEGLCFMELISYLVRGCKWTILEELYFS
jgi:hypothetical protein